MCFMKVRHLQMDLPGVHHVLARAIKDIFPRYKTMKGYQVKRKAGWDTHGLPIELGC